MAGNGPPLHQRPGSGHRAQLPGRSTAGAQRSALWHARHWLCRWHWRAIRSDGSDQLFGTRDIGFAGGTGEQSVVTDAMEPLWQNVQQEAPDELVWHERDRAKPRPAVAAVVLVAERHTALVEADQPAV